MGIIKEIIDVASFVANLITVITGGVALYLLWKKGPALSAAFKLLINFSFQTTLSELRDKIERLNEYNAGDPDGLKEIVNIFHEIHGQICGNPRLLTKMTVMAEKLDKILKSTKVITEPRKRALVSEIREILKNLNVESVENLTGE